jgi:hypothetical protein
MKEPTPEDMSYLSDENVRFCCSYYFREMCKRDTSQAEFLLIELDDLLDKEIEREDRQSA